MRDHFPGSIVTFAIGASVGAAISMPVARTSTQAPASVMALKTPWGESDLQSIWTDEFDISQAQ
jgi:hypothetical protein